MKIINWNIGWPTDEQRAKILQILDGLQADIIILTESTSKSYSPVKHKVVPTLVLPRSLDELDHNPVENRITILTLCPVITTHQTFDSATSVCYDLSTPSGPLTLYATIMKETDDAGSPVSDNSMKQLLDFERLFANKQVCVVGDFNTTFSGAEYPGPEARAALNSVFEKYDLVNVTASLPDCIDHVVLSKSLLQDKKIRIEMWNIDKSISEPIGTAVIIE
jgi:hypothetical protein